MNELLKLGLALGLFMLANIALGSGIAIVEGGEKWNWTTCWHGIVKALIVAAAVCGIYYAGTFVPEMLVVNINGANVTTLDALNLIFKGAIGLYAVKACGNLIVLLKTDTKITAVDQGVVTDTVVVPTETEKDDTEVG